MQPRGVGGSRQLQPWGVGGSRQPQLQPQAVGGSQQTQPRGVGRSQQPQPQGVVGSRQTKPRGVGRSRHPLEATDWLTLVTDTKQCVQCYLRPCSGCYMAVTMSPLTNAGLQGQRSPAPHAGVRQWRLLSVSTAPLTPSPIWQSVIFGSNALYSGTSFYVLFQNTFNVP